VSLIYGIGGGALCFFSRRVKLRCRFDDALDVFAIHGVGGILGMLLTGIFAQNTVTILDSTVSPPPAGWINHVWIQMARQVAAVGAAGIWSFLITLLICWVLNKIPYMSLRVTLASERGGIDFGELDEIAYGFLHEKYDDDGENGGHDGDEVDKNEVSMNTNRNKVANLSRHNSNTIENGIEKYNTPQPSTTNEGIHNTSLPPTPTKIGIVTVAPINGDNRDNTDDNRNNVEKVE